MNWYPYGVPTSQAEALPHVLQCQCCGGNTLNPGIPHPSPTRASGRCSWQSCREEHLGLKPCNYFLIDYMKSLPSLWVE